MTLHVYVIPGRNRYRRYYVSQLVAPNDETIGFIETPPEVKLTLYYDYLGRVAQVRIIAAGIDGELSALDLMRAAQRNWFGLRWRLVPAKARQTAHAKGAE